MPFLQPQLITRFLNLDLEHRKNASFFRHLINEEAPKLKKVPLVKGDITYPFWMKDISSTVWMRLKKKAGLHYKSTRPVGFLLRNEEYVQDLFHSDSVQNYPAYDYEKVKKLVGGFYLERKLELAGELNWWLAFEIFRKAVSS